MLTALTRKPGPALVRCALEYLRRQPIDFAKAQEQHEAYEACLVDLGVAVISMAVEATLPDAVFVEDPAVVLDEVAVITTMGSADRRAESSSLARALSPFRPLLRLQGAVTLEGGDVLRAGHALFAGVSTRTNEAGARQLAAILQPYGYTVTPVDVRGCLHLKTACSNLGNNTILAKREWIDTMPLQNFDIVDVPRDEPWSANVLRIGDTVLVPASHPETARLLQRVGYRVRTLDISEFMKAEAGLTCLSLLFDSSIV